MTIIDIQDALKRLSEAHGPASLRQAYGALMRSVASRRRAKAGAHGTLAATLMEAMRIWDVQRADGVSLEDRLDGMERTLRVSWPVTREWNYLCENCCDTGLRMLECPGDARCGRVKVHQAHQYGQGCWCEKGIRFRDKPKPTPDDFTAAGRSKPTRIGR